MGAALVALAMLLGAGASRAQPYEDPAWAQVPGPTNSQPRVIGRYTNGCVAGAAALPSEGDGYQVIRLSRNRFWGHPDTVAFVEDLGRRAHAADLPLVTVADMGQPRGGPITGHAAHELGLDVDIWLRQDLPPLPHDQRESLDEVFVTGLYSDYVTPGALTRNHAVLIWLAAADPRVERIFVHPSIKRELCAMAGTDRSWLRKVRPWGGHNGHFHVRLGCPAGSRLCERQDPVPPGDGCGEELMSWFPMRPPEPGPDVPPPPPPPMPPLCLAVLDAP